jgi:hypothetical protein
LRTIGLDPTVAIVQDRGGGKRGDHIVDVDLPVIDRKIEATEEGRLQDDADIVAARLFGREIGIATCHQVWAIGVGERKRQPTASSQHRRAVRLVGRI